MNERAHSGQLGIKRMKQKGCSEPSFLISPSVWHEVPYYYDGWCISSYSEISGRDHTSLKICGAEAWEESVSLSFFVFYLKTSFLCIYLIIFAFTYMCIHYLRVALINIIKSQDPPGITSSGLLDLSNLFEYIGVYRQKQS
jgi:hypothetical protein